ncbi:MAG: MauE/DoxX family redox-associated membrane protein [Planctomycetota bacterium]
MVSDAAPVTAPRAVNSLRRLDATGLPLLAARLIVGLCFVWMGGVKALEPLDFHKVLKTFNIFPLESYQFFNFVVIFIPWLEITLGIAVLCGVFVRSAFIVLFVMLLAFTIAIFVRGFAEQAKLAVSYCQVAFDCGCGSGVVNVCNKLAQNVGLIVASAVGIVSQSRRFCAGK